MAQNNNPFADFFKQPFDAWKSWGKQPSGFGFDEAISAARKHWEAAAEAGQAAAEGMQALAKRQWEIAQANAESAFALFKDVASSKDPKEGAAKQADYAKSAIEKSLADSKELLEIAAKSNSKVCEILSSQVSDNIKEYSKSSAPSSSGGSQRKAA